MYLLYARVFVYASCYELHAVVQTRGESQIGVWPWGIMFFSGTALMLLAVLMMAYIHTVFAVSSLVQTWTHAHTHTYTECFLKSEAKYIIKLHRFPQNKKVH